MGSQPVLGLAAVPPEDPDPWICPCTLVGTPRVRGSCDLRPCVPMVRHPVGALFFFGGGGPDQDELTYPAHHMVLETTSQNQGRDRYNGGGWVRPGPPPIPPLCHKKGHNIWSQKT